MPRPPEYCGSAAVMPYSGEKYAIAAGRRGPPGSSGAFGSASAYQRGSEEYWRRSRSTALSRPPKSSSAASAAIRADGKTLSIAVGSPPEACQAAGSIDAKRSAVG